MRPKRDEMSSSTSTSKHVNNSKQNCNVNSNSNSFGVPSDGVSRNINEISNGTSNPHQQGLSTTNNTCSSSSSSSSSFSSSSAPECFGCHKAIKERFLLKALDHLWHEDCLKCACCDCRLGEVGSTLFTKANLILCKRDYLRMFGTTGLCSACNKQIPAFEMVMRARSNVYHLECFACQQCDHRFCVGDRFYMYENKILCEYDYEERMVFANLTQMTSLDHLKRQTQSLVEVCNGSSGYASSDSPLEDNR